MYFSGCMPSLLCLVCSLSALKGRHSIVPQVLHLHSHDHLRPHRHQVSHGLQLDPLHHFPQHQTRQYLHPLAKLHHKHHDQQLLLLLVLLWFNGLAVDSSVHSLEHLLECGCSRAAIATRWSNPGPVSYRIGCRTFNPGKRVRVSSGLPNFPGSSKGRTTDC